MINLTLMLYGIVYSIYSNAPQHKNAQRKRRRHVALIGKDVCIQRSFFYEVTCNRPKPKC